MHVVVEVPAALGASVDLVLNVPVTFGRTGHGCDVGLGTSPAVSRRAVGLCARERGRLAVTSLQSVGTVEVVDDDGLVVATLQRGDVHVLDPAPRTVVRVVVGGVVAALRVEASAPARPTAARDADGGAGRTVSPWSLHALRFPAPENEWMVVAVLAVLADESGSPFRTLREDASAWLRVPVSAGRLTGRLDKALAALGLEAKGDKIPVIARRVRESGILAAEAWHEVRAELARRRTLDGGGA